MRYQSIAALLALAVSGCGGDAVTPPPAVNAEQPVIHTTPPPQVRQTPTPKPAPEQQVVSSNIPVDARYTIACGRYTGGGHEQQARHAKETMIRQTGRNDFYVIHEETGSMLLYGYYRDIDHARDPSESNRAADDRKWLESLKSPTGERLFRQCVQIAIPTPDPAAPAEWNLVSVDRDKKPDDPNRAYWTIVIAAYTNEARDEQTKQLLDRKKLAVDTVRDARAMGVPAYYYHGKTMSQVCVGTWPRRAVREQAHASAESATEGKANSGEQVVVSTEPLPQDIANSLESQGKKVFQPKLEVQDQSMMKVWRTFPEYAVDGLVRTINQPDPNNKSQVIAKPQASYLTAIPRPEPSLLSGSPTPNEPPPTLINPMGPGSNTGGRLRQLDR